ncbi:DUF6434 domain-containing protein [Qiania dongpingensis]|uniref:SAP domain-containing protein n=1 Tax=Qiania dongpingensis TaxID=2763669 RepID=A0A7G9G691_9FIRM|nr:DUF6434 domain-containing protein [Qiania dongpingensis]QNM06323.1 hypothetical protein H9Q78_04070 [Qiania dongpingensis]
MTDRFEWKDDLDGESFRSYYHRKEELVEFCRRNGLSASGGKVEITDRIAHFLDTGEILKPAAVSRKKTIDGEITDERKVESDFVCSEKHRAFFKERIGNSFTFNVAFQRWLKENSGKTYRQATEAYYRIMGEKKAKTKVKTEIGSQFEYNTYIRDFFEDNKGRSLKDAILCWNNKKNRRGHNRYEKSDLDILL